MMLGLWMSGIVAGAPQPNAATRRRARSLRCGERDMADEGSTSGKNRPVRRKVRKRMPDRPVETPQPIVRMVGGIPVSLPALRCMEDGERE